MPRTLTASPEITGDDTTLFIPGPTSYPPLDPAGSIVRVLTDAAVSVTTGTYPASDTYPGADTYPGKGGGLPAQAITPQVLTETSA